MSYKEIYELSNELYAERLELVEERIEQIIRESAIEPAFADYFRSAAKCINTIKNHSADKEFNDLFYSQFDKENYEKSYANPAYAVRCSEMSMVSFYRLYMQKLPEASRISIRGI